MQTASPQRENGHIDIANDYFDHLLAIRIPGRQRQILDVIIRQTWGYLDKKNGKHYKDKNGYWVKKKIDSISNTQFEKFTGLKRRHVNRAIKELLERNLITKNGNGFICKYGIQKDWHKWKLSPKMVTITKNGDKVSPKMVTKLSPKMVNTKEKKEIITKENIETVFSFWKQNLNHPKAILSKDRVSLIKARLKEGHTIEKCKQAILGCKASAYHMGDNDNGKNGEGVIYDSIDLIFRKGDKLEQFISYYEQAQKDKLEEEVA